MTAHRPRIAVGMALIAALVLTSACSSGANSRSNTGATTSRSSSTSAVDAQLSPAPATTASRSTTVTTSTRPSVAVPVSSTASATPSVATCGNAQLTVRSAPAQGGDSHGGVIVIFTNTATAPCTIYGYPGAAVVDKGGQQIVQAARSPRGYLGGCRCTQPEHLRLAHGQSASAIVEGDNGGGDECLRGVAILATPPNTKKSTRIPLEAYSCHVQVHPAVRGTTGTQK